MDGWMDGWVGGRMDGWKCEVSADLCDYSRDFFFFFFISCQKCVDSAPIHLIGQENVAVYLADL